MKVEDWDIHDVKPYLTNPRVNDDAISAVANSIHDFGFQQPIVVDKDGVIIVGHTRLKAAQSLGLKRVPVVVASNLSEEEANAYRLADNKTNELADWDNELLNSELNSIVDFDMSDYGFDLPDLDDLPDPEPEENDKQEFNFQNAQKIIFDGVGEYGIPQIEGVDHIDSVKWISFNYLNSYTDDEPFGVHHFIDDYQFEREWSQIDRMIPRLQRAKYVTSPDFSIYADFPKALQIWNHYRKHWIGAYMELQGIQVIPTIAWSDESSYDWCFDGEPREKPVAVSSIGVGKTDEEKNLFLSGYTEMLKRLEPSQILYYGPLFDEIKDDESIIHIDAFTERLHKLDERG